MDTNFAITQYVDLRELHDHLIDVVPHDGLSRLENTLIVHTESEITAQQKTAVQNAIAAFAPDANRAETLRKNEALRIFTEPDSQELVTVAAVHRAIKAISVVNKRELKNIKSGTARTSQPINVLIGEAVQALMNDEVE